MAFRTRVNLLPRALHGAALRIDMQNLAPQPPNGWPGREDASQILPAADGILFFARAVGRRRAKVPADWRL